MIKSVRCVISQNNNFSHAFMRRLSAGTFSFEPKHDEYADAIPFEKIPGPGRFQLLRRFLPGGKFQNLSITDIQKELIDEFGDIYRLPGVFGQNSMVTTFNADDIELIHRNEGTYPYRPGNDTMTYFRKNIRSDVYEVEGLAVQ